MQLSERQQEIIDEFQFFDSWMDKYQHLIDLGKDLEPLEESEKNQTNLVRGCQSQVWMVVDGEASHVSVRANSDAAIVSGLIALAYVCIPMHPQKTSSKQSLNSLRRLVYSAFIANTGEWACLMLQRLKAEAAQLVAKST